jgi:6-phosphofructokinase 1
MIDTSIDTTVLTLGEAKITSPIQTREIDKHHFISDDDKVLIYIKSKIIEEFNKENVSMPAFELAGPRSKIYFDPSKVRCAIVTCGGLCPGLNDIIRSIVLELYHGYGVRNIYGIQYGLQGFIPKYGHDIINLTPDMVVNILDMGGTILGSSRGPQEIEEIIDSLERMNVGILFMIGGDGTLMAATKIAGAIDERGLKTSIVGIPKTIDNDIYFIAKSFGFDTAVEVATSAIKGAHNEAEGYPNGIGLIKLMGRHSGYIASTAALAQQDVNFVLIPEIDFDIEGPDGFLAVLEKRIKNRKHSVIVVAEGAGQKYFEGKDDEWDASGNIKLKDIGLYLKEKISKYFKERDIEISLKYIDPSYMIRSLAANANDSVFCGFLGRDAVHAGMAGKTKIIVGHWNNHFVHVPMELSAGKRKNVSPDGKLWRTVLESTGQGHLKNH